MLYSENLELEQIETPVNAEKFKQFLIEAKYCESEIEYLYLGFKYGFDLDYQGPTLVQRTAPNLKLRVGSKVELWNKMMKEVSEKRFAGPFEEIPFTYYVQSPIGLVPKDQGKKTRLIFHLSYPRNGDSVNSGIHYEKCRVVYPSFDEAVKICILAGRNCKMAKSDMSRAFRNVPLKNNQ